jgi:N-acetylglucosaminyldiphosphoundecaprenol N-acetyl-beta-D-mannosaminyltransferase
MNASDLSSRRAEGVPPVATRHMLLGVPVDDVTAREALAFLADAIERDRAHRQAPTHCAQVVTLNPEMLMAARRDTALREAIRTAALVVADGIGIVLAVRLLGVRLRGRVAGVDLLEAFAGLAAERGYRIYLLGAPPGVARMAGEALVHRHPGLIVAGSYAGSPAAEAADTIVARLAAARPDALFVAFGSPAQERWLAARRGQLGAAVAIGVGGALDMLAGRIPRAPHWMRRAGLEWLYRLWRQPWRWRRMLALPRFAVVVGLAACRLRLGRVPPTGRA